MIAAGRILTADVPLALVVAGAWLALRAAVPRGALAGPLALFAAGGIGLASQHGLLRPPELQRAAPIVIVACGVIVAMSRSADPPEIYTGVGRYHAVLVPMHRKIPGPTPRKLIVRALLGSIRLDLREATYPKAYRLWVDVTVLMGRVELVLPEHWQVQAGRVDLARGVHFEGLLESAEIALPVEQHTEDGKSLVVLNVLGLGGAVNISRG